MSLKKALAAAHQFGAEAVANDLPSWSKQDRQAIAEIYGVSSWRDIPTEDQNILLVEYRGGERQEKLLQSGSLVDNLLVEISKEFTPVDWEDLTEESLRESIEKFLDQGGFDKDFLQTRIAFERWMGW